MRGVRGIGMNATRVDREIAAMARGYQAASAYYRDDKSLASFLDVFSDPEWSHWSPPEERAAFMRCFRERYEALALSRQEAK